MKNAPTTTEILAAAWNQAIAHGKLINEFQAAEDDLEGQWVKGDRIAFGIQPTDFSIQPTDARNHYYARNLTRDRKIHSAVEERTIQGIGKTIPFTCQFNGYRALRPGGSRRSLGPQPDISANPQDCRFSCQDSTHPLSLLVREPMLQQQLAHFTWKAYYNAAPIEPDGHFLWVPTRPNEALTHLPQALSLPLLKDAFSLFKQLPQTLLFFNSLHAGASVNHIHFQAIAYKQPLPVETWPLIQQSDHHTLDGYPAPLIVFDQSDNQQAVEQQTLAQKVFTWIDRFQQRDIPFNLMFVAQRIILIPRNIEHEIVSEFPGNGIAALGICGRIITINRAAYLSANQNRVESAFRKMVGSRTLGILCR